MAAAADVSLQTNDVVQRQIARAAVWGCPGLEFSRVTAAAQPSERPALGEHLDLQLSQRPPREVLRERQSVALGLAVQAPSPSPSEKITEEARPGPTGTTATHGRALKAILQNAVTRFPTENIITNMYFYFVLTMFLLVVFYVVVFQMLEEEHEKDS
ncbi:unnamed protein product [Symbiodinium sp. CCMP2592]|nr:unnamed protein product [Symbiodinium sp. CCMP2592]